MATLLLFLRAIVSATDESLAGELNEAAALPEQRQQWTFSPVARPATVCGGGAEEEEERWLVACLEWPRVDRKSAWMQIV
ncbi:hypothetical protein HU200_021074 [Digitaria exilis]|uniref:Secreted protein n=1 Tax=Digitaria exilis TaxID=1010633 RepID=A0A835KFE9_9POAL|nr:hypothetical protein HU200_021074 [Digitaria exilis]CAB3472659.1 unnamed protein product [Digitaria exilis]